MDELVNLLLPILLFIVGAVVVFFNSRFKNFFRAKKKDSLERRKYPWDEK